MDTESDTGVSDVDSVMSGVTAPLRPAFPPIKKEKLADGSEVLFCSRHSELFIFIS